MMAAHFLDPAARHEKDRLFPLVQAKIGTSFAAAHGRMDRIDQGMAGIDDIRPHVGYSTPKRKRKRPFAGR